MNILVLIPAYNEAEVIRQVVLDVLKVAAVYRATVLVMDDGSTDGTVDSLNGIDGVNIISHAVNCGVGAAWQTGFLWVKDRGVDIVVTMDGDGQHRASDLEMMLLLVLQGKGDIINGSRFLVRSHEISKLQFPNPKNFVPFFRRLGNFLGNVLTWVLSGIWVTDSQSGMKAFNKRALELLNLRSTKYEVCSEVFREAGWFGLKVYEVPISVKYTKYSMAKGQGFSEAFSMVARLVIRSLMR